MDQLRRDSRRDRVLYEPDIPVPPSPDDQHRLVVPVLRRRVLRTTSEDHVGKVAYHHAAPTLGSAIPACSRPRTQMAGGAMRLAECPGRRPPLGTDERPRAELAAQRPWRKPPGRRRWPGALPPPIRRWTHTPTARPPTTCRPCSPRAG